MLRRLHLIAILIPIALGPACAGMGQVGGNHVPGYLFTDTVMPVSATPEIGTRKGTACITSILGLVTTGDASIQRAKEDGAIREVVSVDVRINSVLGIYATYCTEVHGH